jgi:nucleotide-binding universal stress UspA family protein
MKKVIICLPLNEELQRHIFDGISKLHWLADCDVDFVHIFKQEKYPYTVPSITYPNQEQMLEIQKTLTEIFSGLTKELNFKSKAYHVAFNESPKNGIIDYLSEHSADLVITYTEEKNGITDYFSNSFTEFLIKHAPCNVLTLR